MYTHEPRKTVSYLFTVTYRNIVAEDAPTNVFERAGESRMTPPASSISSQVRPRISCLRQPE